MDLFNQPPGKTVLRDYQVRAVEQAEAAMAQKTGPVLLVAPTGAGKTVILSALVHNRVINQYQRPMFLSPRREITYQTAEKMIDMELDPGIIMAGHKHDARKRVHVASVDTLRSWVKRGKIVLNPRELLIVDEAARSMGPTYQWLINAYRDAGADVLGVTATPIRSDGVGLGQTYKHMIAPIKVTDAIKAGWLVPVEYRVPSIPDLTGVKTRGGDYSEEDIAAIMDRAGLVSDTVESWVKHASGKKTLLFASGVAHSKHCAERFNECGIPSAHVDGNTPMDERDAAVMDLRTGKILVLCNHAVFSEGTDIPEIECIQDCQPTKSLGRHIQKWGRGMRPSPGKARLLVVDNAGNALRMGRIDRDIDWELCEGKEIAGREAERKETEPATFVCADCKTVFSKSPYCPTCGLRLKIKGKAIDCTDGELVALTHAQFERIEEQVFEADRRRFYLELLGMARKLKADGTQSKVDGWAAHVFKDKFEEWPQREWAREKPMAPTARTVAYTQYRNIRNAKRREKQALASGGLVVDTRGRP